MKVMVTTKHSHSTVEVYIRINFLRRKEIARENYEQKVKGNRYIKKFMIPRRKRRSESFNFLKLIAQKCLKNNLTDLFKQKLSPKSGNCEH